MTQAQTNASEATIELLNAVLEHDRPAVLAALAAGADPNLAGGARLASGYNALHLAVAGRDEAMIATLLAHGAKPNLFVGGVTPIGLCAYSFFFEGVRLMAEHGADTLLTLSANHTPDPRYVGSTLLHRVMERPTRGDDEVEQKTQLALFLAETFLKKTGEPLPLTEQGLSPLQFAIEDPASHALRAWFARRVEAPALRAVLAEGAPAGESEPTATPARRL